MEEETTGHITSITDHGSIIAVVLSFEDGSKRTIYFDQHPFWNWFNDTGKDHPLKLIGMYVEVMDDDVLAVGLPY